MQAGEGRVVLARSGVMTRLSREKGGHRIRSSACISLTP